MKKIAIGVATAAILGAGAWLIYDKKAGENSVEVTQSYQIPEVIKEIKPEYDVIIVGGEPEGVSAAVSAARNGAKVLLIEEREELGGLFTYGMLNFLDIPFDANGNSVSKGIFGEWHKMIDEDYAFGIEEAKATFYELIKNEKNITLLTQTEVTEAIMEENKIVGLKYKNENGNGEIKGKKFIDATQDADFAALADVPYFVGGADVGMPDKKMAVTLMIHLKDVDWEGVKETAKSGKFGGAEVDDEVAWGFEKLHKVYQPVNEGTRLRGLNLVKIEDDYYINALQIFGIDGLDEKQREQAIELGKKETQSIVEFLNKEFKGFENAKIASYPSELYVRETRHIEAEYQLTMADVWTNNDQWDSIGWAAYPVDVQAQTVNDYGYVLSNPKQYAIPFRSLVPQDVDGILVVGRAAGYSSWAAGSARVVPTGMVTGEAAGVAATLAIEKDVTFREMTKDENLVKELRTTLEKQGAYVKNMDVEYPYEGEYYDEAVQQLIKIGVVSAGYNNDLAVGGEMSNLAAINILNSGLNRTKTEMSEEFKKGMEVYYPKAMSQEKKSITLNELLEIISKFYGVQNSKESLIENGILEQESFEKIDSTNDKAILIKDAYVILADALTQK